MWNYIKIKGKRIKVKLTKHTLIFVFVTLTLTFANSQNFSSNLNWHQSLQFSSAKIVNKFPNSNSYLGTNLSGIADWSTQLPFLDAFKSSRKWITQCVVGEPGCSGSWDTNEYNKLDLDEDGWVKSLPVPEDTPEYTRVATLLFREIGGRYPGGQYVVLYDGEGTIEYKYDAEKDGAKSTPGRDVINVTPSDAGIYLTITSTDPHKTGNYIRNIHVVQAKYEKIYKSEIFNPKFIDKTKKFKALRFMDWMNTNSSEQKKWEDRPKVEKSSYAYGGGVPIEVMVKLANRLKAEAWFNMPHMATDEYIINFAKTIKDNLNPNLKVYVEFSNEVWNGAPGFQQHQYALAQGRARWGNVEHPYMQWYGMRTAQMCDIWKNAFGSQSRRVVCVMATHTAWRGLENYALDCPKWVAEGNAPCYQHGIDAFAITGYFSDNLIQKENQKILEGWANEPDGGFSKVFTQLEYGSLLTKKGDDSSLAGVKSLFKYHSEVAKKRNLQLVAYEGGQHLVNPDSKILTDFYIKLNRRPEMYKLYAKVLDEWKNHGGGLFMNFADIAKPSKWGSWGALEYVDQDSSPKYDALIDFINKKY